MSGLNPKKLRILETFFKVFGSLSLRILNLGLLAHYAWKRIFEAYCQI
jgi:hypothetical protein